MRSHSLLTLLARPSTSLFKSTSNLIIAARMSSNSPKPSVKKGVTPSPSASLIVICPLPEPGPDGCDFQVMMLRRTSRTGSSFASGWVFPGGNCDKADSDSELWMPVVDAEAASDPFLTTKICAIRETFEESGLLLTIPAPPPPASLSTERTTVHTSASTFPYLLSQHSLKPALSSLTRFANWVTPPGLPKRFDTQFFISRLPRSDIAADARGFASDGQEAVELAFFSPREALQRALPPSLPVPAGWEPGLGGGVLYPPQAYILAELAVFANHSALMHAAREREPNVQTFAPRPHRLSSAQTVLLYPGDHLYAGSAGKPGALNRGMAMPVDKVVPGIVKDGKGQTMTLAIVRRGVGSGQGLDAELSVGPVKDLGGLQGGNEDEQPRSKL